MCKHIKDILFPLNVLGKKKRSVEYTLPSSDRYGIINVVFAGEYIDIAWTSHYVPSSPIYGKETFTPQKKFYANGDGETSNSFQTKQTHATGAVSPLNNKFYFNCTNVTKLIINGEQYI